MNKAFAIVLSLAISATILAGVGNTPTDADSDIPDLGIEHVDAPMDFDWRLQTLDGRSINLKDFRGKVLFLHLWASWCPTCLEEMNSLDRLWAQVKVNRDIQFFAISEEIPSAVRQFLLTTGRRPSYPIYISSGSRPHILQSYYFPTTYIVSKGGRIVAAYERPFQWDSKLILDLLHALSIAHTGEEDVPALEQLAPSELPNRSRPLVAAPWAPEYFRLSNNARSFLFVGQDAQAKPLFERVLKVLRKYSPSDVTTAEPILYLGIISLHEKRYLEAAELEQRARQIVESKAGTFAPPLAYILDALAAADQARGAMMQARVSETRALNIAHTLSAGQYTTWKRIHRLCWPLAK